MRDAQIADQIVIMKFWRTYMFVMYGLHYLLGLSAVVLSVTVASKPFEVQNGDNTYALLAWALAALTGVIAFVTPERIGDRYHKAFRMLSVEITRFRNDQTYTVDHVLQAYERGEDVIHAKRATE
ncbi:hypothetical protein WI38_15080 [Burkholderia ubonensis]|uniref:SMODS and SLOG-associating 2TM effector domain-containing protein n=1 Tax=Burkholderia ubonensis TaxID=101571 RepID=A0A102LPP9_9BURK|nr:hypothetical protein WI35_09750 [Burkholderia ubonensis]KUZ90205.1 hypothetical protein WI38_15080 [Burkholderia ubonensis]KUZ97564.1 hypothetical protein WI39_08750 [Burkholderia ubonensis]